MSAAETIVERFVASPAGQRLVAEARAELYARRARLVREIAEARDRFTAAVPELDAAIDRAEARHADTKRALDEAASALALAANRKLGAIYDCDNAIAVRERELRATAEPVIAEFMRELSRAADEVRAQFQTREGVDRNWLIPRKEHINNNHVLLPKLDRLAALRQRAERLRLEDTDAVGAVAEMRKELADILR